MFKYIFLFIVFFVNAFALDDFVKIYLNGGINALEKAIEKELANNKFWKKELKDQNVSLGYYSDNVVLVVANKNSKIFNVYFYSNGKIEKKFTQKNILTGLMGDKKVEGDLITPIGFYELGQKFFPGDQYYGPFAFSTTYPNLFDKVNGKTGGGIWIHGYPLNGDRIDEKRTRGCIALFNDKLEEFATLIKGKKVYTMIEEDKKVTTSKDEIANLLASLFAWKNAWTINDIKTYLSFYDENNFKRYDKTGYKQFAESKKSIFSKNDKKIIKFSKIDISPYPNIKNEKLFRVSFYEDYWTKNYQFNGDKILYVRLDKNGNMKILAE